MMRKSACRVSRALGFTLLELLVVISIIGIIATFAIPAVNSASRGSQLTQGAQTIGDQLNLARQTALARNRCVEVRFYQFGDSQFPGEQANVPSTGKFRAMQTFEIQESGTAVALGKLQRLPPSIIIDSGVTLSTLLDTKREKAWTATNLKVSLPRVDKNYNCRAFQFLPDGSTDLAQQAASRWFLTLHNLNDGDALTTAPANFFTIQLDANNGHIQTFRP